MDQNIKNKVERLKHLGYRSFQIRMIIREAVGNDIVNNADASQYLKIFVALEKYEQLGSTYMEAYSK